MVTGLELDVLLSAMVPVLTAGSLDSRIIRTDYSVLGLDQSTIQGIPGKDEHDQATESYCHKGHQDMVRRSQDRLAIMDAAALVPFVKENLPVVVGLQQDTGDTRYAKDNQCHPSIPRSMETGIGRNPPQTDGQSGGQKQRDYEVPKTDFPKTLLLVCQRHRDTSQMREHYGDTEKERPMASSVVQQAACYGSVYMKQNQRSPGAGMMGGMAEQQEKNGQSPHVEPETDSNAGLSRVRRREQKAVQKKQKRSIGTGSRPGCDAEAYHEKCDNSNNQWSVEIELSHEPPEELTDAGRGSSVEKRLDKVARVGKKTDTGLVLEIGQVIKEPTYGEENHGNEASPPEVSFLRRTDFHARCILAISLHQWRPMLEYVIFIPKSRYLSHNPRS